MKKIFPLDFYQDPEAPDEISPAVRDAVRRRGRYPDGEKIIVTSTAGASEESIALAAWERATGLKSGF